jgi:hypothetical protein
VADAYLDVISRVRQPKSRMASPSESPAARWWYAARPEMSDLLGDAHATAV